MAEKKRRATRSRSTNGAASGRVQSNHVAWISEEGCYREVLDDSDSELELGEIAHSVISNIKTGVGHFEYGPEPKTEE